MLLALISILLVAGLFNFLYPIIRAHIEKPKGEKIVELAFRRLTTRNAEGAYRLFTDRAKQNLSLDDLKGLVSDDEAFVPFSYYIQGSSTTTSCRIYRDPSVPGVDLLELKGVIIYQNGMSGTYTAVLEQQEPVGWMLDRLDVQPDPKKNAQNSPPAQPQP